VGGVSAQAATAPLKLSSISVSGTLATIKWSATALTSKDFFEIEFTKTATSKTYKVIKTKSNAIVASLEPFTSYTVRLRKTLTPKAWTPSRTFTVTSSPVSGIAISGNTYTSVDVSWPAVIGASSYEITLDKNSPVTTNLTKYTFAGLKPGYFGKFSVRAVSGTIKGESSQPIEISTLTTGPTKLASSAITSTGFTLTWAPITGAVSYNVYKDEKVFANSTLPTLVVSAQIPGSSADYSVKAVIGGVETDSSETFRVTTLVDVPTKPVVTDLTANTAKVSWTLDPNADSYEIDIYDSLGTTSVKSVTADKSVGSTIFTGLASSTTYTVGISNVYGKLSSKPSALTSFTTLKPTVTGVSVSTIGTTTLTLSWAPLSVATSYEVYRDGISIATAVTSTLSSYVFTSLVPGQSYRLGVRAVFADGLKGTAYTEISETTGTTAIDPAYKPAISTSPVITLPYANVPIIGATLVTNTGTWTATPGITSYSYQWQKSIDGGSTFGDISGATSSSYVVTVADNTYVLRAKVSATNINGTGISYTVTSSAVASVYNIQVPIVRGNAVVGEILEVSDGTWFSNFPITLSYKWITSRTGTFISGAVSPSFTVPSSESGYTISAQVTASTSHGYLAITSPSRGLVTIVGNTVLPVISGTLRVGGTLSVSDGTWLNLGNDSTATYQWQSSTDGTLWNNISGATSSTYVLKVAQAGTYIRAQVFNTKSGYTAVIANSAATSLVPVLNITNLTAPVVTGEWTVGTTISASTGSWSTNGTYTYQWQSSSNNSSWSDIASATSSTFVLTSSEASKYVRIQVINTSTAGSGIAYSASRSKVGAPFNTVAPAISGTAKVGSTQTVTSGTWTNTPTSYAYQWQKSADGISWLDLSGETNSTYVPTFDVANLQIRVNVSGVNAVDTATVTSAVISGFVPPQATAIPAITGTKTVGQTLTSSSGTWPSTSSGYVYQWQKSSDNGVTWANIAGATASTYVLVAADAGYQIRSQVSLTANVGSSSAYSLATVGIAP
jgi:hypothetical protein